PCYCDRERVIQALSNLLANAVKVVPNGGSVTVDICAINEQLVFSVIDDGPGIPDSDLPRLFDRYWRGKDCGYKGAGLGLAIVKGLIDAHGGRVWVESKLGEGATFRFSLPRAVED